MNNLLKYEFRKLFRNPLFYILFGVMVAFVLLQAFSYKLINDVMMPLFESVENADESQDFILSQMSITASNFYMQCLTQSYCVMIVAVFTAIFALSDNSGPIKNIVARGYTRTQVHLSKYTVSLFVALTYAILIVLLSYPLTAAILGKMNDLPENAALLLFGQILSVAALHSVFFAVDVAINKTVLAVFANILAPSIITLILSLIDIAIDAQEITVRSFWVDSLLSTFTGNPSATLIGISFAMIAVYICGGIFLGLTFAKKKQY
mgnify:CR=1 FL=1